MILSPGQIISNTYEIIEKIGSGGMSIVYKARHVKLNRYVTLKVMREEHMYDEEFIERFKIEARAVASLSHPNIVGVYDVVTDGRVNFIVMEYVDGLTLKNLIAKKAPFANDEILGVAIQINDALTHAHANGIVHRDIKPQNILVTKQGLIKVTDFGIARTADANTLSAKDQTMGSVHYFSPEQARGGFVDEKSDMYSLGILMYEMATAELPFDGETPVAVALRQLNDPLPDIRSKNPEISESVEAIIIRLTDKQAKNRYLSDADLSDALKLAIAVPLERLGRDKYQNTFSISGVEFEHLQQEVRRDNEISDDYEYDDSEPPDYSEEDSDDDKKADFKIYIAAFATALCVIAIVAYFVWKPLPQDDNIVLMPNLIHEQYEAAVAQMSALGFELLINQELYSDDRPKGEILDQNYTAGVELNKDWSFVGDDAIMVNVSRGPQTYPAPDMIGLSLPSAQDAFEAFSHATGCTLRTEYVPDSDAEKDVIVSQKPEIGEEMQKGDELIVYVSTGIGADHVYVPRLIGLSEGEAREKLASYKLELGEIKRAMSDRYEKGIVSDQSMNPGKETPERSIIDITISEGIGETPIPETPSPTKTPEPSPVTTASSSPDEEIPGDDIEGDIEGDEPVVENTTPPPPTPKPSPELTTVSISIDVDVGTFLNAGETATVKIFKRVGGELVLIWEREVTVSDFPLTPMLSGKGIEEIVVFINGIEVGSKTVSFE